jgi:tetratricopeptide (TPR) repeat protein
VEVLAPFTPYELNSELYLIPIYLRGQAYLAMGQSTEARIEFQKILDQPGITRNFITGSLARLGLADAEAHAGNKAKARADYTAFLALWHDADPDLPLLKTARASLQSLGN